MVPVSESTPYPKRKPHVQHRFRLAMDGVPESARPAVLWPSANAEYDGYVPAIPESVAWHLLDPNSENGLKSQLAAILSIIGSNIPDELDATTTIDDSAGTIYIDDLATIGPSCHIIGPCYIGPRCDVRHGALVRANTWACADSVIGHATEVKHSILFPSAKAPHFNYVGDSILGSGVNLGAGVKLSNLRHDGKEVKTRYGEGRIATGLRKFGALLGEGCQLGCNAVTNPGVILGCDSMVVPNATVSGIHGAGSFIS